jgi:hypothetical protein
VLVLVFVFGKSRQMGHMEGIFLDLGLRLVVLVLAFVFVFEGRGNGR